MRDTFANRILRKYGASNGVARGKAGFYADRVWAYNQNGVTFNGQFDFGRNTNNPLDTNYAYANAALGVFNSYTEASARPYPWALASNIEWFVQDNWKVGKRLTLDYGVRFHIVSHPISKVTGCPPSFRRCSTKFNR